MPGAPRGYACPRFLAAPYDGAYTDLKQAERTVIIPREHEDRGQVRVGGRHGLPHWHRGDRAPAGGEAAPRRAGIRGGHGQPDLRLRVRGVSPWRARPRNRLPARGPEPPRPHRAPVRHQREDRGLGDARNPVRPLGGRRRLLVRQGARRHVDPGRGLARQPRRHQRQRIDGAAVRGGPPFQELGFTGKQRLGAARQHGSDLLPGQRRGDPQPRHARHPPVPLPRGGDRPQARDSSLRRRRNRSPPGDTPGHTPAGRRLREALQSDSHGPRGAADAERARRGEASPGRGVRPAQPAQTGSTPPGEPARPPLASSPPASPSPMSGRPWRSSVSRCRFCSCR